MSQWCVIDGSDEYIPPFSVCLSLVVKATAVVFVDNLPAWQEQERGVMWVGEDTELAHCFIKHKLHSVMDLAA